MYCCMGLFSHKSLKYYENCEYSIDTFVNVDSFLGDYYTSLTIWIYFIDGGIRGLDLVDFYDFVSGSFNSVLIFWLFW